MSSMTITWTAQVPSGSALPTCGHASAAIASRTRTDLTRGLTTGVVRDAKAGIEGGLGLAQAHFPATSAWRPPIC